MKRIYVVPSIVVATAILLTGYAASQAATDWLVTKTNPPVVGVQVAHGAHSAAYPDITWPVTQSGSLQAVFYDHDPKCDETVGVVFISHTMSVEVYPVPTAYFHPDGDCTDPVDGLYASRSFTVGVGDIANADQGDSSGQMLFNFATYTPTPTSTPTETPPATEEPTATTTSTSTPTETPPAAEELPAPSTSTLTPTSTATATDTPTATATPTPTNTPTVMPTADTLSPTNLEQLPQPPDQGHTIRMPLVSH